MTRIASILVLLLSGVFAPAAEATAYDLYYLGGQSNMDGFGYLDLGTQFAVAVHELQEADRRSAAGSAQLENDR